MFGYVFAAYFMQLLYAEYNNFSVRRLQYLVQARNVVYRTVCMYACTCDVAWCDIWNVAVLCDAMQCSTAMLSLM